MADIISDLRGMANAGTADYTIGTATYWSDDHLQIVLDRYRTDLYSELMTSVSRTGAGGTVTWHDYYVGHTDLEQTDGGTAIFFIEHGTGEDVGTANYSVDYRRGYVNFPTDTGGSAFYVTARSYDLFAAAADVWEQKAAHYGTMFDFSTDNHRVNKGKIYEQCLKMAAHFRTKAKATVRSVTMVRDDERIN
jgi:hypothetical protein